MNSEMTTNLQLSTTEPKNQKQNQKQTKQTMRIGTVKMTANSQLLTTTPKTKTRAN